MPGQFDSNHEISVAKRAFQDSRWDLLFRPPIHFQGRFSCLAHGYASTLPCSYGKQGNCVEILEPVLFPPKFSSSAIFMLIIIIRL